jgi:hypothetical protein
LNDPFEFALVLSEQFEKSADEKLENPRADHVKYMGRTKEERLANWKRSNAARGIKGDSLTEVVRQHFTTQLGVVCLTRTQRHLLMWSHYAEGHRGMLLEFDENHSCFHSGRFDPMSFPLRTALSFTGRLIPVVYSDARPQIHDKNAKFAAALTTKALEWAYEQEVRMFLPLEQAELTSSVDGNGELIRLTEVPSSALRAVTLGCLSADTATVKELIGGAAKNIAVYSTRVDAEEYRLHYERIE